MTGSNHYSPCRKILFHLRFWGGGFTACFTKYFKISPGLKADQPHLTTQTNTLDWQLLLLLFTALGHYQVHYLNRFAVHKYDKPSLYMSCLLEVIQYLYSIWGWAYTQNLDQEYLVKTWSLECAHFGKDLTILTYKLRFCGTTIQILAG